MMDNKKVAYSIVVLILLTLTYLVNQLCRYMLNITTKPIAQEIHYGDIVCLKNTSLKLPSDLNCEKNGTTKEK